MSKDNREECPKCKGAGGFEYPDEIFPEHQWSECDECDGTGEVTLDSGADANGWISVDDEFPDRDNLDYYGNRYSKPVIIYYYDILIPIIVRWDFSSNGWVDSRFRDGCDPYDYDYEDILYYAYPPKPPVTPKEQFGDLDNIPQSKDHNKRFFNPK